MSEHLGQTQPLHFTYLPTIQHNKPSLRTSGEHALYAIGSSLNRKLKNGNHHRHEMQFGFHTQSTTFGEGQALFFCSSSKEAAQVVNIGSIPMAGNIVYANRYHRLVNTIGTNISRFIGRISIKGLLFYS